MDPVLDIIERSNQRGGRMLSVVDLIEEDTLPRGQACWLLARILGGASFLVGARPGGAGKTAVVGALLAMLPASGAIRLTTPRSGWEASRPGDCIVAYEIGRGHWEAYVWGSDLVRMTHLGRQGCRIVTNLHADTLEQAREQIVEQCGAGEEGLQAFGIFVPIETHGGGYGTMARTIGAIRWYDGTSWRELAPDAPASSAVECAIGAFLDDCVAKGIRTISQVRQAWLEALSGIAQVLPQG